MRSRWRRGRGYMDEAEELMRVLGEQARQGEALIAEDFERDEWPLWQREAAPRELVRRALGIPFFGRLLETALRIPPGEKLVEADMEAHPWDEGESMRARLSASRAPAADPTCHRASTRSPSWRAAWSRPRRCASWATRCSN